MGLSQPLQGVPKFDNLEVVKTGNYSWSVTFPSHAANNAGTDNQNLVISHNLGYIPIPLVYTYISSSGEYLELPNGSSQVFVNWVDGSLSNQIMYVSVTTTQLILNYNNYYTAIAGGGGVPSFHDVLTLKYYLLRSKATD